jgi:uncharacterized protein (UPF0335 family)
MTQTNDDLSRFADRIEMAIQGIEDTRENLAAIKAEATAAGYDGGALVKVVEMRHSEKRRQKEEARLALVRLYADRLGVQLRLDI